MEGIGKRIRWLRRDRGLTQERLSDLSGIFPTTISQIETRKQEPKVETVRALAQAMNVSISEIVFLMEIDEKELEKKRLGSRILSWRKKKNLFQRDLAKKSGMAQSSIHYIERGKIQTKPKSILSIINAFGITIEEFFSYDIDSEE